MNVEQKNVHMNPVLTQLPAGGADVPRGVDVRVTGHHVVHHHPALRVHLHLVPVLVPGRAHSGGRYEEVTAVHTAKILDCIEILESE